ncbi:fungal-specific transcription factor domain-containing protein [Talaromyces proteolyticus]|uniref:Fungal-specific transcription factor domain-containing protein n=1 Tax=Talaromyces proteolyticus TaxID=1131652 RepID=A0AAD4KJQ0_9EURO|nr:fungal-specific transcription factor domain-containing protein [Talaromyces proteolyticus]KAH8690061.1 fungal-specific transcription factor domain-containing protein [Talaromyces proteolyticus]
MLDSREGYSPMSFRFLALTRRSSDVCKRHTDRCRAVVYQQQNHQPEEEWGPVPQAISDTAPSFTALVESTGFSTIPEEPRQEQIAFPVGSPQAYSVNPASIVSVDAVTTHTKAYFEYFHQSLPLVHRPTFTVSSTPKPLMNITVVIGSLYTIRLHNPDDAAACVQWSRGLWESGCEELSRLVSSDWRELRKTWVMQSWLLYIIYGAFMSDRTQFEKAKQMLRTLVDAVRELGLLRQSIAMPNSQSWRSQSEPSASRDDSQTPYTRWRSYVNAESMKLSLYTLMFLDFHVFSACNIRPLISPMEFEWELPFPSSLWEANNAEIWLQRVTQQYEASTLLPFDDSLDGSRGLATTSLSLATQELMSESPSPDLLTALAANPLATLYVLTNLDSLVRDFTRCYYQLPPSLSDPSAFHILTQSQNRQMIAAMRSISKVIKDQAYSTESPQYLLWRAIEFITCSIKVSLCKPDNLLIGGIVDNSLIAGLATATHLTLGSYTAVRRSATALLQHTSGEDAMLPILDDLTGTLLNIAGEDREFAFREAPWVTVTGYGILLTIWRVLRGAISDIRSNLESFNKLPKTSESCMLIFNSIMEPILHNTGNETADRDPRLWSRDRSAFASLLDESETLFIQLVQRVCKDRPVWGIGPSMATVLEEIVAASQTTAGAGLSILVE